MSYLHCTNCGQKALSVATRCPHCGVSFEARLSRHPEAASRRKGIPLGLIIAGAVVTVLVVIVVRPKFRIAPPVPPPATPTVTARPSQPQAPRESLVAKAESVRAVPRTPPQSPSQSQSPAPTTGRPVAPTPAAMPVSPVGVQRRYASTWMNVRADKSNTAQVVQTLHPGDSVFVDLLEQGWYRVVTDGQPIGYVDWRYLDTLQP